MCFFQEVFWCEVVDVDQLQPDVIFSGLQVSLALIKCCKTSWGERKKKEKREGFCPVERCTIKATQLQRCHHHQCCCATGESGEHILHGTVGVKCEQTQTSVAACLWLLNNLNTLVCEDILVHMLYNRWAAGLALSAQPLRPILSHFLC